MFDVTVVVFDKFFSLCAVCVCVSHMPPPPADEGDRLCIGGGDNDESSVLRPVRFSQGIDGP